MAAFKFFAVGNILKLHNRQLPAPGNRQLVDLVSYLHPGPLLSATGRFTGNQPNSANGTVKAVACQL